ncbi:condensation domain-containing protein [Streptomyces radicis]|uniref:Polyketide synthase n=1 Tax=Streptomyces radicis TaxID=1750517 RepID=A0A3A9VVQ8_9ACTN|nr:condensation domain-containing protein [Streptomyces radicis]RKN04859.1 polyketide synthase [Streptomyces radicis]RKN25369.1 polyketide synthase [Streptomyces radicis]
MTGTGQAAAVAVIGVATRFPEAPDLAAFRANLRAGRDSVRPIPAARVESTGLDPAGVYPELGYLDRIDLFDHEFFGLSRREAEVTDPQHRLALHLTQEAMENAGHAPSALRDSTTAVIFSSPSNGYLPLVTEPGTLSLMGNIPFALPARIAHLFGLNGPCYGVDTGCNGSLVAVHQGCRELRDGDADYAVVGGVSLRHVIAPAASVADFPGIASPTARSRAFDEAADGAGGGEGGAVLLLTTLERALDEGAFIHAVLRGSATAHNGRHSATIATPSARAQADVIRRAWDRAGLDIATAGYVEAHGSGTRLGDAVEVEGLALARPGERRPLAVGSVKTNVGHLDHAAGIAGLVKTILSVRHGELYPTLHFRRPAAEVDLEGARLDVVAALRPWRPDGVRRAGVSSFSLGGVNAHVVVEEPPPAPVAPPDGRPLAVGVSARGEAELVALCERLSVELRDGGPALADVAWTLNAGRDHHTHRVGVVASRTRDLAVGLAAAVTWRRLDGARPGPAGPAPRVVFLLSGDAQPPAGVGESAPLPAALPVPEAHAGAVRGQLAAHAALGRAGIAADGLISSGLSRYAVRHLNGALTADDTAELAAASGPGAPLRPERLRAAADEQLAAGPVVFVELGARGELSDLLADHVAGRAGATVLTAAPGTDGVLGVLARLYELGLDPDWEALTPAARRVPLPGHPFSGVRCWARPDGEILTAPPALPPAATPAAPPPVEQAPVQPAVAEPESAPEQEPEAQPQPRPGPVGDDVLPWLRRSLAELLYADDVAPDDDYFAINGNSIIALLLLERVEQRYGVSLRMVDVYDHSVVADLAAAISAKLPATAATGAPEAAEAPARAPAATGDAALPPIRRGGEPVLSYGQERMWFHHQMDPATTLYNLPGAARHHGPIDPEAMRLAWEDLAERHEALRSNFVAVDGRATLVIRPGLGDFFRYEDLTGQPDAEHTARAIIRVESERVLHVERDPLVRVTLIRLAPDDHLFCWLTHHAVNDGWAPQILMGELMRFYAARCEGRVHRFDPLPVQYRDYALWQRELMDNGLLEGELRYWSEHLNDPPALELPTDRPRAARMDFAGAAHGLTIPPELVTRLRALGARESATLFMVLLTGLNALLSRWSGQDDIVIGTPTIGRTRPELWGLLGFFNNTIALRSDLSGDPTFAQVLRRVRTTVIEGLENQEIPFDAVVREVAPRRDPGRNPIFDVMYVHQTLPPHFVFGESLFGPAVDEEGGPLFPGLPPGTAKFDISVVVGERAGADDLDVVVEYSTQLFERDTIAAMMDSLLDLLWAATGETDPPLSALPGRPTARHPGADARWRELLGGIGPFALPTDRPRPQGGGEGAVGRHAVPFPADLAAALGRDGLLAALATLLTDRAEADALLLGLVGDPGGPLPLVIDVADEPSLTALSERIARLRADARAARLPGGPPAFDITVDHGGGAVRGGGPPPELHWSVADGELAVEYRTELFDEATAVALADDLIALAHAAVTSFTD